MISSCTVFRDHAATLGACLRAAAAAVDELVALDTGSLDGSDAIARACGARVESFPWREDIAAARNAAMAHARGDWILIMDADDELLTPEAVRPLAATPGVDGWILRLEHAGMEPPSYGEMLRLFRAGLRYEGIIHEQLLVPPDWTLRRAPQVRIRHSGFTPEALAREDKAARNLRLGQLELARDPDSPRARARAAKCFLSAGRPAEALDHYLKALELNTDWGPAQAEYYLWAVTAAQRTGNHALARRLGEAGLARYPDYVDLLCLTAWSCLQSGDVPAGRAHLLEAVFRFERLGDYPLGGSVTMPGILDLLGRLPPG